MKITLPRFHQTTQPEVRENENKVNELIIENRSTSILLCAQRLNFFKSLVLL